MKIRISAELPSRERLLVGLAPREVHPPLVRAEESAAAAEQALERARGDLADLERSVAALPSRIHRGEVRSSELAEALRRRDAAALAIGPAERELAKARERVTIEEKNAAIAADREFVRRVEQLERVAAELGHVLAEFNELAAALAATRGPGAFLTAVDWPCSPRCAAERRAMMMSTAPAETSLAWSTKP
jgi:DNA repair exonuclease SbcCD ATPase subunit